MTSRTRIIPGLSIAALVFLAACGSDADDDATAGTSADTEVRVTTETSAPGEAATTDPVVTEPVVTQAPTEAADTIAVAESDDVADTDPPATQAPAPTDAPATDPPTTDAASDDPGAGGTGGADCLVGDWVITQDELNGYYDALETSTAGATGASIQFDITGEVGLTFTETEYTYVGDFDLALDLAGQSGTGNSSGSVSGTWTAEDGRVLAELGSSDLEIVVTVAGQTFDQSAFGNDLIDGVPINEAPYDCDGPTLGYALGEPGGPTYDVTLTPA